MKFLIVDDHPMMREGAALALCELHPGSEVLEADTLPQALTHLASLPPVDLLVLDLDLAESKGIETLTSLKAGCEKLGVETRIVVLSGRCEPDLVLQVIDHVGTGFILKATPKAVFQSAIQLTLAGGVYIPPAVLRQMVDHPTVPDEPPAATCEELPLSPREMDVVSLLVQGYTYKQIAKALERRDGKPLSDHTVRAHVGNIAWKLGVTENAKSGVMAEIARRRLTFPGSSL